MKKKRLGAYAGLDLSLAGTGGVLLDSRGELVSVLAFCTSKREVEKATEPHQLVLSPPVKQGDPKSMWKRTVFVAATIRAWMQAHAEPGCLVGIEDHAFGARGTSIYQLGHLHGMVRRDLQDADKHWLLIAPTELKSAVTGKGNADKNAMMKVPTPKLDQKAFGASTRNNVVDAYWLARCAHAWGELHRGGIRLGDLPESMSKVMQPHAKKPGLLKREVLP
jgi:Holliday junction resolvasome RuvABC endonuclease subunit